MLFFFAIALFHALPLSLGQHTLFYFDIGLPYASPLSVGKPRLFLFAISLLPGQYFENTIYLSE